jgi:hypothetical protein
MRAVAKAPILEMGQGELTELMTACLREDFGELRCSKKEVAHAANSNPRTAENWLVGRNTPDLLHALRLAVTSPAWRAQLLKLLGLDDELDGLGLARAMVARMEREAKIMPAVQTAFDFGAAKR